VVLEVEGEPILVCVEVGGLLTTIININQVLSGVVGSAWSLDSCLFLLQSEQLALVLRDLSLVELLDSFGLEGSSRSRFGSSRGSLTPVGSAWGSACSSWDSSDAESACITN